MDVNQNNVNNDEISENISKNHSSFYIKDVSDRESNRKPRPSLTSSNISLSPKLSVKTKLFFSVGHIYNDLTGAIWFSYTLLFFHFIFPESLCGVLFLIGQIADAAASPFVGYHSDKSPDIWLCRYGRRKTWHLLGVVMTTISVPLVYTRCPGCQHSSQYTLFFYYAVLITIFQAAMAFLQVSHVTLITDLTTDTNERIALNAYRYVCYKYLIIK
jgi:Na+/melibiose symporter-like transporter